MAFVLVSKDGSTSFKFLDMDLGKKLQQQNEEYEYIGEMISNESLISPAVKKQLEFKFFRETGLLCSNRSIGKLLHHSQLMENLQICR